MLAMFGERSGNYHFISLQTNRPDNVLIVEESDGHCYLYTRH